MLVYRRTGGKECPWCGSAPNAASPELDAMFETFQVILDWLHEYDAEWINAEKFVAQVKSLLKAAYKGSAPEPQKCLGCKLYPKEWELYKRGSEPGEEIVTAMCGDGRRTLYSKKGIIYGDDSCMLKLIDCQSDAYEEAEKSDKQTK